MGSGRVSRIAGTDAEPARDTADDAGMVAGDCGNRGDSIGRFSVATAGLGLASFRFGDGSGSYTGHSLWLPQFICRSGADARQALETPSFNRGSILDASARSALRPPSTWFDLVAPASSGRLLLPAPVDG